MTVSEFCRRLAALFRRRQMDADLDEEMRHHLELATADRIAAGAPPGEARRRARARFGNALRLREEGREQWGFPRLETIAQDLRYGLRMLARTPAFTLVAVLTLALGIGANTAMFSVVSTVLLHALPFPRPHELVTIAGGLPEGAMPLLRARSRAADYAGYQSRDFNLLNEGTATRVSGLEVSAEFFRVLGRPPLLGRAFREGEDTPGRGQFVILSYGLWQRSFRGDRDIAGQFIQLDNDRFQIIGVMPPDAGFPSPQVQLWVPMQINPANVGAWHTTQTTAIARLRPGVTLDSARAELALLVPEIRRAFPWRMPDDWGSGLQAIPLQQALTAQARPTILLLEGGVGLLLLIACANVASLLLARANVRRQEIALRAALGAAHRRLLRQLLTESILLSFLGSAAGLLLAQPLVSLLASVLPPDTPGASSIQVNAAVLAFTAAVSVITGIGFGLAPALRAASADPDLALRSASRSSTQSRQRNRLGATIVAVQVALAALLVVASGLLLKSLWQLTGVDPGFQPDHVLTARLTPNQSQCRQAERCLAMYGALLQQVRALPGVENAAAVEAVPLSGDMSGFAADAEDNPVPAGGSYPMIWSHVATPQYRALMRIPLLRGRDLSDSDSGSASPVILVSERTARRFWPGQDPVGKHLKPVWTKQWRTVVGVVGDVHVNALADPLGIFDGEAYIPYAQSPWVGGPAATMSLVVRTAVDPRSLEPQLSSLVHRLLPGTPIARLASLPELIGDSIRPRRATALLLVFFGVMALMLGAIGIYGAMAYAVTQRIPEFGIRMALGAQARQVMWLVLRGAAWIAGSGLLAGLAGAALGTRILRSFLFQVAPLDGEVFAAVALLLCAVALLAAYLPARRAARLDPVIALRSE